MQNKKIFSSSVIPITTTIFILCCIAFLTLNFLKEKQTAERNSNYLGCTFNMCKIEKGLARYKKEHKGKYPKKLSQLVPKYLKQIPECPIAHRDTYSESYIAIEHPQTYFFCCSGKNHIGPKNTPQCISDLSFFSSKAENPNMYIYGDGNISQVLHTIDRISVELEKKEYLKALEDINSIKNISGDIKAHLYMLEARCHIKLDNKSDAYEAIKRSLDTKFYADDWNKITPFISYPTSVSELLPSLLSYINKNEDLDAIIYTIYIAGDRIPNNDIEKICKKGLEISKKNGELSIPKFYFKGKLAEIAKDNTKALNYFMSIRSFVSACDFTERIITSLAEKEIHALQQL